MNIKFVQEPGYIADLLYVFSLHFNRTHHLNSDPLYNKMDEDKKHIVSLEKEFADIPEELRIFFFLKPNGRCFMTTCYFSGYADIMSTKYSFDFLLQELMDHNELMNRIIVFYFPDIEKEVGLYRGSLEKLSQLIDNSEYTELIKRKLYSFFVNPQHHIQKLIYELMAKEVILEKYYKDNYRTILDIQNNFMTSEAILRNICIHLNITLPKEQQFVCLSVCLLNKNCIWAHGDCLIDTIIIGYDYESALSFYSHNSEMPDLKAFGEIFSEQNRIDILRFMCEQKEITSKDLERQLNFTGSTAYYHLTMMLKENMITARNQGRSVLYSINPKYFEMIVWQLNSFR
ncbi:MAG: winged helix-turn-helix transcriptional regulator [Ruminococcaceae bacterium]|nr:winged helix-turn-helix transcriptional regulator [Oscillospiraceae bacterium]